MEPFQWDWRKQHMISSRIQKIELKEYSQLYLCIGSNEDDTLFWFLKIFKTGSKKTELDISYTSVPLKRSEKEETLKMMEGDQSKTRMYRIRNMIQGFGIIGFVRFIGPYYIIVITKKSRVANIGPYAVYKIDGVQMIPLGPLSKDSVSLSLEEKYKKLFQSVDLTVNFYFSYGYDLTNTLQYNLAPIKTNSPNSANKVLGFRQMPRDKFMWNAFLLKPMLNVGLPKRNSETSHELNINDQNHEWVLCVIHGFVSQMKLQMGGVDDHYSNVNRGMRKASSECVLNNVLVEPLETNKTRRTMLLTVIARRSRLYAGTRFNKRGANCQGDVANEVELEQLVGDYMPSSFTHGRFSSFVQLRGSVPLLWSQTAPSTKNLSFKTKPEIRFDCADPCYIVTGKHFMGLLKQYGSPIIVFNLVKKKEGHQENKLTREFTRAIQYFNQFVPVEDRLDYYHLDMSAVSKRKGENTLDKIIQRANSMVEKVGVFYTGKVSAKILASNELTHNDAPDKLIQTGIVRVNCVDCLDRTNTAQFALGLVALRKQILALGVTNRDEIGYDMHCVRMLEEIYDSLGDTIALQYGSSYLVHRIEGYRRKYHSHIPGTRLTPTVQSISRYYNNTFSDKEKQEAINVFLGVYRPSEHHVTRLPMNIPSHHKSQAAYAVQSSTLYRGNVRLSPTDKIQPIATDDALYGLRSLPLWDMESDYSLHHVFDTSITTAVKSNHQWFNSDVVKCLPRAWNEVSKDESFCGVVKLLKKQTTASQLSETGGRSSGSDFIDWYIQFYRPFRLTSFDMLLKLNKHFLTIDRLKMTSSGHNQESGKEFVKSVDGKVASTTALLGSSSNEAEDFSLVRKTDKANLSSKFKGELQKKFSLMDDLVFPLFGYSAFKTAAISAATKGTFIEPKVKYTRREKAEEVSDLFFEFPKYGKPAKKKTSTCKVGDAKYGFEILEPSSNCLKTYENYVEVGKKSGIFKSGESADTNQKQPVETDLKFSRSKIVNAKIVDNGDTLSSVFVDHRCLFDSTNSSQREVYLKEPSNRDDEIYKNYVQLGKSGADSVPTESQRKYEEYIRQKYQNPT